MTANRIDIYSKTNGRDLYDSLSINEEVLNKYWNRQGKFESFSKFRDLNGFDNLQALEELTVTNKDQSLCAIGTNQIFKATKSDLNKDFETITIDFEDKAEAELYKDYLEKNLKTNSVMKPHFEIKDNQLEYTYCRVCLDEDNKKLYRASQNRLTLNNLPENQKMNSVNENCLLMVQEIHKKDKERLFSFQARDNVVGMVSSNDSLGLNDTSIEQLKDKELESLKEVKEEATKIVKEEVGKAHTGSNPVNSNIQEEKAKNKEADKIEKDTKKELEKTNPEMSSFLVAELAREKAQVSFREQIIKNQESIMSSFHNYMNDGADFETSINKLTKSYSNPKIREFIIHSLKDQTLEMEQTKENNKVLTQQTKTLTSNLSAMQERTDELTSALEDNVNTINELVSVNETLDSKLENSQSENKTLTEQNETLTKDYKLKANEVFDLTEENKKLTEDHNDLSLENAELKSEVNNKDKEIKELKSINSELGAKAAKTDNLETMIAAMKEQEAIDKKEKEEMIAKLNKLQTENVVLNTKVQTLKEVMRSSEPKKEDSQEKRGSRLGGKIVKTKGSKEETKEEEKQEEGQEQKPNTKKHKR